MTKLLCPDGARCQSSGGCFNSTCARYPSSAPPTGSAAGKMAIRLREERDLARCQMADELRTQFSHVEYISRMQLMEAIAKAERFEQPNAPPTGERKEEL